MGQQVLMVVDWLDITIKIATYVGGGLLLSAVLGIWHLLRKFVNRVDATCSAVERIEPALEKLAAVVADHDESLRTSGTQMAVLEVTVQELRERRNGPVDRRRP